MIAFLLMTAANAQMLPIDSRTPSTTLDFGQADSYIIPIADPRVDLRRHYLSTPEGEVGLDEFVEELRIAFPAETRGVSRLEISQDERDGHLRFRNADGPIVGDEIIEITCYRILRWWVCVTH